MRRWGVVAVGLLITASACSDGGSTSAVTGSVAPATPPGPITLSVVLDDDEVTAGEMVTGFLVFENTGPAVDILTFGCTPVWAIALVNEEVEEAVQFTDPCPEAPLHIPTGRSQLAFTTPTWYTSCTDDPDDGDVGCPTEDGAALLPAGIYETVLVSAEDLGGPPPAPVTVTITG